MTDTNGLLTLNEAADIIHMNHKYFINTIVGQGKIRIVKISDKKRFIRREDFEKYLLEHSGFINKEKQGVK